jgi:chromosomal replication initiator protein
MQKIDKQIIAAVCQHFDVARAELLSPERLRNRVSYPRQICHYMIRTMTPKSYTRIGWIMKRDHSTIMHSCHKIERMIKNSERAEYDIAAIKAIMNREALPEKPRGVWYG